MKKDRQLLLLALFGVTTAVAFVAAHAAGPLHAPVEVANNDGCGDDDNDESDPPDDADTMPPTIVKARA